MNIKIFQKQLKTNQTNAEQTLWYYLRNRHLGNYKFRRQVIIDSYIVDFVCFEKKLIVECDGGQHNDMEKKALDEVRTQNLVGKGYRILRFWNHDILEKTEDVLNNIYKELQK
ncbi:endonuclease domain-containing protein [Cysteiniphilum sp. QT6929]|uniref:endonuclease domain-containing protein n=1 Tax=Cysteiniphilum sp. QT6929 TaxID=2975055 RepID=UPI0024B32423|nr:endonuclease domain-containing protein [Cysteiniphilum sp. QT6929]WHN65585.1 endonuclease domain-containing protein [Cysteiniphilum sp. QT6929]